MHCVEVTSGFSSVLPELVRFDRRSLSREAVNLRFNMENSSWYPEAILRREKVP